MSVALAIFSTLIIILTVLCTFFPTSLLSLVEKVMTGVSIWAAVSIRLLLAILLWFSAEESHTPLTFQLLAGVALIAAIALPILGQERMGKLIRLYLSWPKSFVRMQCLLGMAFGGFMLWSISASWSG